MTADLLRTAASKMRERAQAATAGKWRADTNAYEPTIVEMGSNWPTGDDDALGVMYSDTNARHIASWHPLVALAVADWLDWVAAGVEAIEGLSRLTGNEPTRSEMFGDCEQRALTVAHAYLGTDPDPDAARAKAEHVEEQNRDWWSE